MNLWEMERVGLSRTISFARLIGPKSFLKFKHPITHCSHSLNALYLYNLFYAEIKSDIRIDNRF